MKLRVLVTFEPELSSPAYNQSDEEGAEDANTWIPDRRRLPNFAVGVKPRRDREGGRIRRRNEREEG